MSGDYMDITVLDEGIKQHQRIAINTTNGFDYFEPETYSLPAITIITRIITMEVRKVLLIILMLIMCLSAII